MHQGLVLCAMSWFGELMREEPAHAEGLPTGVLTQMSQMIFFPYCNSVAKEIPQECSSIISCRGEGMVGLSKKAYNTIC